MSRNDELDARLLALAQSWRDRNCRTEAQDRVYAQCAAELDAELSAADTRYELTDAGRAALEGGK